MKSDKVISRVFIIENKMNFIITKKTHKSKLKKEEKQKAQTTPGCYSLEIF